MVSFIGGIRVKWFLACLVGFPWVDSKFYSYVNKYFARQTFLPKKTGFIACDRINFPFFGGIRSSSKFTLSEGQTN